MRQSMLPPLVELSHAITTRVSHQHGEITQILMLVLEDMDGLRFVKPIKPNNAEPNSQTAAGIGTALTGEGSSAVAVNTA